MDRRLEEIRQSLFNNGHIGLAGLRAIEKALQDTYDMGQRDKIEELYNIQHKSIETTLNAFVEKTK